MSAVMDVTEATFQKEVLDRSHEVPVVVDFWAEWCGPCRTLGPVLERLADESGGEWVLAKVDVDTNQRLAGAAGVQGIPAVRAFRDGKQIAEFTGALPEPQVRRWLAQLGPSEADLAMAEARELESSGDLEGAVAGYRRVLEAEPGNYEAKSALAALDLRRRTESADLDSARAKFDNDPLDLDAAIALSDADFVTGDVDGAADRLVEIVKKSSGDTREAARKHLLSLLDTLPVTDPRVVDARRALSLALF